MKTEFPSHIAEVPSITELMKRQNVYSSGFALPYLLIDGNDHTGDIVP